MPPLFQVDAFAPEPFGGNPAAVCLLESAASERWMQAVAAEMNLSETAFLVPHEGGFDLRWFTPAAEVALCGHATLASAHVLWETGMLGPDSEARFHTKSGILLARRDDADIEMDFPAKPTSSCAAPEGLQDALGVRIVNLERSDFDYLAELPSEDDVVTLAPDLGALARLPVRGVIVTARAASGSPHDFVSRFFAPAVGVNEDPVTGSAHCALAPYWASRLRKIGMSGFQASARGGVVRVTLKGDRVLLAGRAVTVLRGELVA